MTLLFVALALLLQTPSAPPRDTPATSTSGSFVIRGRVTDAITGQPLQGVQVGATPVSDGMMAGRGALTDADGKWEVTGLPTGDYTLSHGKNGYNRVRGLPIYSPVHVSAQNPVRDIELVLMRGGVIGGRVLDASGEPMPGIRVSALRVMNNEAWSGSQGDTTDDRGDFRLYGLEPGEYYISASPEERPAMQPPVGIQRSPVVTYYPRTSKVSEAERVALAEQGEIRGLTIEIQTATTFTISGRVLATGDGFRWASVQVYDDEPRQVHVRGRVPSGGAAPDGRFAIAGMLPGEYVLTTHVSLDEGEEIGEVRVVVDDKDVDVVVQTRGPTMLSGRVVSAGGGALPFKTLRISTFPAESQRFPMPFGSASIQSNGTFQLKSYVSPLRLRVDAANDPLGWRVREIRFRGQSVMKTGLDVGTDPGPVTGIEVVVVGNTARVRGTAKASDGTPLRDGTVVIVPQQPDGDEPLIRAVITAGAFVSRPIAPGRYFVAAIKPTGNEVISQELIEGVRSTGSAIELSEHETATLALTVMR